jgi:hypothetical protein
MVQCCKRASVCAHPDSNVNALSSVIANLLQQATGAPKPHLRETNTEIRLTDLEDKVFGEARRQAWHVHI